MQQKKRPEERTWLEPWGEIPASQRDSFLLQLNKEITQRHPLFGRHLELIGRSFANDDLLVVVDTSEWVVVHLTWLGSGDSRFPLFESFDTWSGFVNNKMAVDNEGF
ncbi:hypothetical protein [Siphonobacter sp. SORGH_AS_0500]|uniref:hypothetical protein n=1 Tax=Siphonobacter sp. SORGH_AS_0500 TaxID=1864824 RepID=UPI0028613FB7|nr:hypothetical protein [Siphonobacter sp. SORGH_AS_0500]MDR6193673.1 hypothetical protein [Siphonobacter sp. SORGH_AS_0500]